MFLRALAVLACVLAAAFWFLRSTTRPLAHDVRAAQQEAVRPVALNGLTLDLSSVLSSALPPRSSGRALLFVVSDTCPACQSQLQMWRELLKAIPGNADVEVIVASTKGSDLADVLARERPDLRQTRRAITSLAGFAQRTGISWTPHVLVLDTSSVIRGATHLVTPALIPTIVQSLVNPSS